jgi:hypothetical protein
MSDGPGPDESEPTLTAEESLFLELRECFRTHDAQDDEFFARACGIVRFWDGDFPSGAQFDSLCRRVCGGDVTSEFLAAFACYVAEARKGSGDEWAAVDEIADVVTGGAPRPADVKLIISQQEDPEAFVLFWSRRSGLYGAGVQWVKDVHAGKFDGALDEISDIVRSNGGYDELHDDGEEEQQ